MLIRELKDKIVHPEPSTKIEVHVGESAEGGEDKNKEIETSVRLLIDSSDSGTYIGKGGERIQKIRTTGIFPCFFIMFFQIFELFFIFSMI